MKIVKVRSPFIIEVNESLQDGSKIELAIWQYGSSAPTSGTGFYSLSKSISSTLNRSTSYNVSNYVKEFIDNIKPLTYSDAPSISGNNEWIFFKVKRYSYNATTLTYTLLDTTDYVGVNGFTNYSNGKQIASTSLLTPLFNNTLLSYYKDGYFDLSGNFINGDDLLMKNLNFIFDKLSTSTLTVRFENLTNTSFYSFNLENGNAGIFNYSIPITNIQDTSSTLFIKGCKITVTLTPLSGSPVSFVNYAYPIAEYKYDPVECSFVNRYGGWQTLTFFKQQTNSIAVKGTDFKLMPSAINYNTSKGQVKSFNINGTQTIKLNTGFVDQNYSELITDLLLSETVLLDAKPVTVKTQGSDLKTSLKDRLINYEIEFEYAYNLINDVV